MKVYSTVNPIKQEYTITKIGKKLCSVISNDGFEYHDISYDILEPPVKHEPSFVDICKECLESIPIEYRDSVAFKTLCGEDQAHITFEDLLISPECYAGLLKDFLYAHLRIDAIRGSR